MRGEKASERKRGKRKEEKKRQVKVLKGDSATREKYRKGGEGIMKIEILFRLENSTTKKTKKRKEAGGEGPELRKEGLT